MTKRQMYYLILGVALWSVATGFREGFTWSRHAMPLMDYHSWRMLEQLGIVFLVFGMTNAEKTMLYIGINWAMVFTLYEPALDWMVTGEWVWFKAVNPYTIWGVTFNMGRGFQLALTVIGLGIALIAYWLETAPEEPEGEEWG